MPPLLLALALAAQPSIDPAIFAPGIEQLRTQLGTSQLLVSRADATGVALRRLHNRWAEKQSRGAVPCDDAEAQSLAARTTPFGNAHRDAVQSARAAATRLIRLLGSPTITPLLSDADKTLADKLLWRTREHAREYGELSAWQSSYVEPFLRRCTPVLAPATGLASNVPQSAAERQQHVAVIGLGGGVVCPGVHPADGRVVVLEGAEACHGEGACDCVLERVLPGAVLGR